MNLMNSNNKDCEHYKSSIQLNLIRLTCDSSLRQIMCNSEHKPLNMDSPHLANRSLLAMCNTANRWNLPLYSSQKYTILAKV